MLAIAPAELEPTDPAAVGLDPQGPAPRVCCAVNLYGPCDLRLGLRSVDAPPPDLSMCAHPALLSLVLFFLWKGPRLPASLPRSDSRLLLRTRMPGPCPSHPAAYRLASPITHIHPTNPPLFLLHGDQDDAVDIRQSERFVAAAQAAGAQVRTPR